MKAQQLQLEHAVGERGWTVIEKEQPADWWLDELWVLESDWSPKGKQVYLAFLVDPQAPISRRRGEHVWAVGVSSRRPANQRDVSIEVPLRPNWELDRRSIVLDHLEALRGEAWSAAAGEQGDAPDERR